MRSVVRRDREADRARDRATLERHPLLAALHPELAAALASPAAGDVSWVSGRFDTLNARLGSYETYDDALLAIDYSNYHQVVASLLREVLAIQDAGDGERAAAFVDEYFVWDEALHERVAARIREANLNRFRRVEYAALDR